MSADQQPASSGGVPSWLLIVGVGGLVGVVAGAILFLGGSPEPRQEITDSPGATPRQTTAAQTKSTSGPVSAGKPLNTIEDWNAEVGSASVDGLGPLLNQALALQDASLRAGVVEMILVKWLNEDQSSFLDYLDDLEASESGGAEAWPILVPGFVSALPKLAAEAGEDEDLEEIVLWMTDYYAEQNAPEALNWARQTLLGETQEAALATIAGELSRSSLPQAMEIVRGLTDPAAKLEAIANIGAALGESNPHEALQWAKGLTDKNEQSTAVEEVLWAMAESAPADAAREIQQINDPALLESVGSTIAEELALVNPSQALQWAEALPAGPAQSEAIVGALAGWAENDPKAAFEYFQTKHSQNHEAAEWIFESWAYNSPEEAAKQAQAISDPAVRERAVIGVVSGWLDEGNADAAQSWVDTLPAGRDRDQANAAIVDMLSFDSPQPAWERAISVQDPEIRREAMLSAFSGLVDNDPANARQVLESASLTDQEKAFLQSLLNSVSSRNSEE